MEKQDCALYSGYVYKLIPESTKTYSYYKPVKDYIMGVLDQSDVSKLFLKSGTTLILMILRTLYCVFIVLFLSLFF